MGEIRGASRAVGRALVVARLVIFHRSIDAAVRTSTSRFASRSFLSHRISRARARVVSTGPRASRVRTRRRASHGV